MRETYCLEETHPKYVEGELVEVAMYKLGGEPGEIIRGTVLGLAQSNLIDFWIIDLGKIFPAYPYKVASIPHIAILKPS